MAKKEKSEDPNAPTDDPKQIRCTQLADEQIELGAFVCNWDYEDATNARLLFLAEVPATAKGDDLAGMEILVKYWICTKIEIPDRQDGGMVDVVRTTLIGPDDEILSTLSHGILRSVDLMRKTFGDQPYDPPIRMVVKGVSTGTGSDMLMLVPVALEAKK